MRGPNLSDILHGAVLSVLFFAGMIFDQKINRPDESWPRDGDLLSIIRKGEHLDHNRFLTGISGNVTAAQDLALVLLNGNTMIRPLALFSGECVSGHDKADLFTAMGDQPPRCPVMMDIGGGITFITNGTTIGDVFIYGDNRGAAFTGLSHGGWALRDSSFMWVKP